jgi:hypothetical protein
MFVPTADLNIQMAVSQILSKAKKLIDERKNRSGADPWIIAVAQVIVDVANPEQIILFGSRSRGESLVNAPHALKKG